MSKKSERKRVAALESDPGIFRREIPSDAVEAQDALAQEAGTPVAVVGRLMLNDPHGEISKFGVFTRIDDREFITLERVGSNGCYIQAFLSKTDDNVQVTNSLVHPGDIVLVRGTIAQPEGDERPCVLAESIEVLSKATKDVYDRNLDMRKRSVVYRHRHMQLLRDEAHLQLFRNFGKVFRALREYLYAQGYDEMTFPIIQETFEAGFSEPFITRVVDRDRDLYLRVTTELYLRKLMIAGFSRVFEIGKSFRNQGARPTMHPEFTILELYRAYAKEGEMEDLLEGMVRHVLAEVLGTTTLRVGEHEVDCSRPFAKVDFNDEIYRLTKMRYDESKGAEANVPIIEALGGTAPRVTNSYIVGSEVFARLMGQYREPTFLRGLPAATSPLNKLRDDGSTIDETLLVIHGMLVADLVNAERDPRVLRRRMEAQQELRDDDHTDVNEDLLTAMSYGLPPSRGIGMGMERFLMLLFNQPELRDVELFPVF